MLFLKFAQTLTTRNEGEHLELVSISKDSFHPFKEFYSPAVDHEPDVWKNGIAAWFIQVGR